MSIAVFENFVMASWGRGGRRGMVIYTCCAGRSSSRQARNFGESLSLYVDGVSGSSLNAGGGISVWLRDRFPGLIYFVVNVGFIPTLEL